MPFSLPEVEHRTYARTPLSLALCQIRFPPILSIAQQETIAPFQERIRRRYPSLGMEQQLQVSLGSQQPVQRQANWRFSDLDGSWAVTLSPDAVAVETIAYAGRDDFTQRLNEILVALIETLGPAQQLRLGVRYINEIRRPDITHPRDWQTYVRPELTGVLSTALAEVDLAQSLSELRFAGERGQASVKYGAFQQGTTIAWPGVGSSDDPFYLIDLDLFDVVAKPFDVDELLAKVREFNSYAYRAFRWSITDAYEVELGRG